MVALAHNRRHNRVVCLANNPSQNRVNSRRVSLTVSHRCNHLRYRLCAPHGNRQLCLQESLPHNQQIFRLNNPIALQAASRRLSRRGTHPCNPMRYHQACRPHNPQSAPRCNLPVSHLPTRPNNRRLCPHGSQPLSHLCCLQPNRRAPLQ